MAGLHGMIQVNEPAAILRWHRVGDFRRRLGGSLRKPDTRINYKSHVREFSGILLPTAVLKVCV